MPELHEPYIEDEQFCPNRRLRLILHQMPGRDEGTEVRGGGEDESIDEVLLRFLCLLIFHEEQGLRFDLGYADDIGFPQEAPALAESQQPIPADGLSVIHL